MRHCAKVTTQPSSRPREHSCGKSKLCLLVNMISPARLPLYSALAEKFDLLVLHGGKEGNRDAWRDLDESLPNARVKRAWGWQVPMIKRECGEFFDHQYIHITPGYLWDLLSFRPEVVVTNEMGFRTIIALTYGTVFRKPVWVWWGGTLHTERKIGFARRTLRAVISRWARRWISYGWASTEYLRSLGVKDDRVLEIQNAVDENRFGAEVDPEFEFWPKPVLLHVGQFIARKGVEPLLHAAAKLQREGREFSLLLVGSGRDQRSLAQLSEDLNLQNVHFCPAQEPERMPAAYRSADALIFPTLEDVWGLVANEAILSGLPVLCSQYAGCARELFTPENIFDPHNSKEFEEKLRLAIEGKLPKPDPSRLKTTSQNAGELIRAIEHSIHGAIAPPPHPALSVSDRS
jgi:glycosyltransferase involved in cell wall biosynthesis